MAPQPADLYELLRQIRYETTAIQAKVSDALRILGELNLPENPEARCPYCALPFRGPVTLAEHVYISHGGPEPDTWAALERRLAEPEASA